MGAWEITGTEGDGGTEDGEWRIEDGDRYGYGNGNGNGVGSKCIK